MKLWQVCVFYICYAVAKLGVNYPSMRLINRYGARLGLIVGLSATAAFMMLLTAYVTFGMLWLAFGMAIALAVQNSCTWNSEHIHISRVMDATRKSRDLAIIESMLKTVAIFAPVIGGLIAVYFGQVWLTAIASILVLIAIIPIWRLDQIGGGHVPVDVVRYDLKYAPVRDLVANFGYHGHSMVGVLVWPIYLAIFIPNFQDIGIITTVASLIAVALLLIAGKRGDSGKGYKVLVEGTAASSGVHIIRILASSNPIVITIISALYDVALTYQQNPWTSLYYAHARAGGINYIMSMELIGDIAYVLVWAALGAIAYFLGDSVFFTAAFGFAAIIAWLSLFVRKEQRLA